ncbi:MAG: nucleotidyltransferase domain-containing protein [Aquificae bacterium]|nr:nucleotidyltransferase domain-containing protein [Aquificota bacterium]
MGKLACISIENIETLSGAPIRKLKKQLVQIIPEIRLFLFGSYVRGAFNSESDIDLLVVLPDGIKPQQRKKVEEVITDFNFKYKVFVSPVFLTKRKFENKEIPLVIKVLEEGIEV